MGYYWQECLFFCIKLLTLIQLLEIAYFYISPTLSLVADKANSIFKEEFKVFKNMLTI